MEILRAKSKKSGSVNILVDGVIFSIYPHGGIARFFFEILRRIADQTDDIVFYILCDGKALPFLPIHQRIKPLLFRPSAFRPSRLCSWTNKQRRKMFDRYLAELPTRVFHSTYYTLPPRENLKFITTIYDFVDYEFPLLAPNGPAFVERQESSLNRADRVISISQSTTKRALRYFPVSPDKITTIHLDATEGFFPVSEHDCVEFRNRHAQGRKFFLFVGSLGSYKNLATTLRAFARISQRTDHVLIIAGHSVREIDRWLLDLSIEKKVEKRIVLLSHPDETLLRTAYGAADAFVFPSLQEGFGIPLVEAMRCGTPVVASDIEVFREVCEHAALYFDPHDAGELSDVLLHVTKPEVGAELSIKGLERAKAFSYERTAANVENVYREVNESE